MQRLFITIILSFVLCTVQNAIASTVFVDDFNGSLDASWTVLRADASKYSVDSDSLNLTVTGGDLYMGSNNTANTFLIDTPTQDDFIVTLAIQQFVPDPTDDWVQIDLLAYDNDDNHIRGQYGNYRTIGVNDGFAFSHETGGSYYTAADYNINTGMGSGSFFMRMEKIGNQYSFYFSTDGIDYTLASAPLIYGDGTPAKLGFTTIQGEKNNSVVYIDSFEVSDFSTPVPEPASILLLGSTIIGIVVRKKNCSNSVC